MNFAAFVYNIQYKFESYKTEQKNKIPLLLPNGIL